MASEWIWKHRTLNARFYRDTRRNMCCCFCLVSVSEMTKTTRISHYFAKMDAFFSFTWHWIRQRKTKHSPFSYRLVGWQLVQKQRNLMMIQHSNIFTSTHFRFYGNASIFPSSFFCSLSLSLSLSNFSGRFRLFSDFLYHYEFTPAYLSWMQMCVIIAIMSWCVWRVYGLFRKCLFLGPM